jgi:hypothetical protein
VSDVGNSLRIPHYLLASTRDELVRVMFKNNLKDGMEYQYFDISFDGSKWTAWFKKVVQTRDIIAPKKGVK